MATSYKDIIITPNRSNTLDPKIEFRGGNSTVNTSVSITVLPDANGTLAFTGAAGQLFSVTNDLSNTIFSVNDISGIPSMEVYANGDMRLNQYAGNVSIGTSNNSSRLYVQGNTTINGSIITTGGISGLTNTVIGANVYLNTTQLFIGNTVANLVANSVLVTVANSTASANLGPLGLVSGIVLANATVLAVGANSVLSASRLFVGNSTVNSELTQSALTMYGGANSIILANGVSNYIYWSTPGVASPTATSRSAGTKLVIYPSVGATSVDYAIGIEASYMWFSAGESAATGFKWYSNTGNIMLANNSGLDMRARAIANVTTITATSMALSGAASGITTLAAGNSTITGFVNASVSVNSAIIASGANSYINTTAHFVGNSVANTYIDINGIYLANSTSNTKIQVPSAANYSATNVFLHANGSWVTVTAGGGGGTPGGANTQIQFNDSTAFNGTAGFTFDKTTNNVTIANTLTVTKGSFGSGTLTTGQLSVNTAAAGTIGQIIRVAATPTANAFEIQSSAGTPMISVEPLNGRVAFNRATVQTNTIIDVASGANERVDTTATAYGLDMKVINGLAGNIIGLNFAGESRSTGTGHAATGLQGYVAQNGAAGTMQLGTAAFLSSPSILSGFITTTYGLRVAAQKIANVTGQGYGISIEGASDNNYIAGALALGGVVTAAANINVTGSGSYTVSANVGANVFLSTTNLFIGNTTVNATSNSTSLSIQDAAFNTVITSTSRSVGNSTVNAVSNSTARVIATATSNTLFASSGVKRADASGNTEVKLSTSTVGLYANSTQAVGIIPSTIKIGSNMTYSWGSVADGTVGSIMQSMSANTTGITITSGPIFINNSSITISGTVVNSTVVASGTGQFTTSANVGANVWMSTSALFIGNTTVNSVSNSVGHFLANSTSNTKLTVPTVAQYQSQTTYLAANGSWVDVKPATFASGIMGQGIDISQIFPIFVGDSKIQNLTQTGGFNDRLVQYLSPGGPLAGPIITATFNANTGVTNATEYIAVTSNPFVNGDLVVYTTATGNTALTGLTNGSSYYVIGANATALQLSTAYAGAAANITATSVSETGHYLKQNKGIPGWVTMGSSGYTLDLFYTGGITGGWTGPSVNNANWSYQGQKNGAYSATVTTVDDLILFINTNLAADIRPVICLGHDFNDFGLYSGNGTLDPAARMTYMLTRLRSVVEKIHNARQNALVVLIIPHDCLARPYSSVFPSPSAYPSFGSNLANDVALLRGWHATWAEAKRQIASEYGYCTVWDWHRTAGYPDLTTANTANYTYYADNAHQNYFGASWLADDFVQLLLGDNTKPSEGRRRFVESNAETNSLVVEEQYARYCESRPDLYQKVVDVMYVGGGSNYMDFDIPYTTPKTGASAVSTWPDLVKFNPTIYVQIGDLGTQRFTSYNAGASATLTRLTGISVNSALRAGIIGQKVTIYIDRPQSYQLFGNSSVNSYANSTGLFIANSTANASISSNTGAVISGIRLPGMPQNANNASYTTVLGDAGKSLINSSNYGTMAYTIANNTNVPYTIGTVIECINANTATLTIVGQTGVTLQLGGGVTTGTRTVSNGGIATCKKIRTDTWLVYGVGVT
jgi:hypothetical protein